MSIFLLLFLVNIIIIFRKINQDNALSVSISIWAIMLFVLTEILSFFSVLNAILVTIIWIFMYALSIVIIFLRKSFVIDLHKLNMKIYLSSISIWCMILYFLSKNIVPFNWDSMTYHLARVMNWINNSSVSYYVTSNPRQLYSPVFSEYIVLNIVLLDHGDFNVNLVQFVSLIYILLLLESILSKLQVGIKWKRVVQIMVLTMPIVIGESVTTQVDLVGSLWLLVCIDAGIGILKLDHLENNCNTVMNIFACAVSAVFGYLTKGSVCIGIAVFIVVIVFLRIRRKDNIFLLLKYVLFSGAIILLFAMPTFIRNFKYTGNIFASDYMGRISVGNYNPRILFMNMYKNWAMLANNKYLKKLFLKLAIILSKMMKVDIDNPAITFSGSFLNDLPLSYNCDLANGSAVSILFGMCILVFLCMLCKRYCYSCEKKIILVSSQVSVFLAMATIRYQTWGARLLLPYLILMCIFIGIVLDDLFRNLNREIYICIVFYSIAFYLYFTAIPAVMYQAKYYLDYSICADRNNMYFADRAEYYEYLGIVDYINGSNINSVGLVLDVDAYEYPLWKMINQEKIDVYHVDLDADLLVNPDCLLLIHRADLLEDDMMTYCNRDYTIKFRADETNEFLILE